MNHIGKFQSLLKQANVLHNLTTVSAYMKKNSFLAKYQYSFPYKPAFQNPTFSFMKGRIAQSQNSLYKYKFPRFFI